MKKPENEPDDAWFDRLDAIVMGNESAPPDDELLYVAARLSQALAPLDETHGAANERTPYIGGQEQRLSHHLVERNQARSPVKIARLLLKTAAVLFLMFGIGGTCAASPQLSAAAWQTGRQIWQAATSFEQIDATSVALSAVKNAGVRPLLPVRLPAGTQAVEFGIIVDSGDPRIFMAFAADYHVMEQDISVYERPANLLWPSSAARAVSIGTLPGQFFQDASGNRILQWYQDGMTCQMASRLPISILIAIAHQFQPIASWEFIL